MDDERAKVAQEIAKTAGKAVDAVRDLAGFLGKVVGPGLVELGEAFHDWARTFRYANLLRLQDKVNAIHKRRGIEGKTITIPPRLAIPLLNSASLEDNTALQDMWASLIANATDPSKREDVQKIHVDILSALQPIDALVLRFLAKGECHAGKIFDELNDVLPRDVFISLANLDRLGCLATETVNERTRFETDLERHTTGFEGPRFRHARLWLTDLGRSLVSACES